ncbi:MAG: transglycosylase SLT domain-containing protein [Desulfobacteraceae bacterium]|nr:MAG: transglycosylase SLT domain-containing protein [Desulfobacteraceae bacterium]
MKRKYLKASLIFLLFLASSLNSTELFATPDPFPVYPSTEPNVDFWTDVYTKYPTTQGILHDSKNVHIIYDVIELLAPERHGAQKINRKRIKNARIKYKKILARLARNESSSDTKDTEARRIAALFGPKADQATFRKAAHRIRCQIGQKDRFREGLIRSGAYIEEIREIFHSHGLPEDLAYLPHVESSFNPKAYSKFGAAGIWQFTRFTGKQFMTVGYVLDERRDPIQSSKAAAQLLKQNYKKLGNWPMAITAYNHGIAGMLRAKRAKGSYEAVFKDYRSRIFKFASRNFYSEFLAAREVAKNYKRYFGMIQLDAPIETREVVLEGYVSVKDLSQYFKVDIPTIRRLNSSLRPPVFDGQKHVPKGYVLRLPAHAPQNQLGSFAEVPKDFYKSRQKPSRFHRVRRGDTVAKIAKLHGLKVSDLILANNLNSRGTIYVRQNLRLPVPDEKPDLGETDRDTAPVLVSANRPKPAQPLEKAPPHSPSAFEARVPATEFSVNQVMVAGNLQVERIMTQRGKQIGIIQVEIEETLGHYAEWLGIPTQKIRRLNGFDYRGDLRIHQEDNIPLDRTAKEQFEEARFVYHKKIQEDFFNAYKIETVNTYRVKNGDNIWTLCNDVFKMPLWLLKKYNPEVDFNDLRWSQKLVVPVAEKLADGDPGTVAL